MDITNITRKSCDTITITLDEGISFHIVIYSLDDNNQFNIIEYDTTHNDGVYDFTLSNDGIYKIVIGEYSAFAFVTCNIRTCLIKFIKATICGCCTDDNCKADLHYRYIEVDRLWRTYMSLMADSISSFTYDTDCIIDYNEILDITQMNKIISRITELCNDCSDFVKKCTTC